MTTTILAVALLTIYAYLYVSGKFEIPEYRQAEGRVDPDEAERRMRKLFKS